MISDETLMLEFQSGSREAFEELFARYREPLYGFFRRRLESGERAEDLTQETFLAVIRATSRYEPRALVRTYLYGIALKMVAAERRKPTRNAPPPSDAAKVAPRRRYRSGKPWRGWVRRRRAGDSHAAGIRTAQLCGDFRAAATSHQHRPLQAGLAGGMPAPPYSFFTQRYRAVDARGAAQRDVDCRGRNEKDRRRRCRQGQRIAGTDLEQKRFEKSA
jgi:RNA polymerase sigma factor (sigma-70 family)